MILTARSTLDNRLRCSDRSLGQTSPLVVWDEPKRECGPGLAHIVPVPGPRALATPMRRISFTAIEHTPLLGGLVAKFSQSLEALDLPLWPLSFSYTCDGEFVSNSDGRKQHTSTRSKSEEKRLEMVKFKTTRFPPLRSWGKSHQPGDLETTYATTAVCKGLHNSQLVTPLDCVFTHVDPPNSH